MKISFPASLRVIGRSIVDWWDAWLDLVLVTIVWLLAQFTVILGPPATFGVYYVVHNMLNGEALGVRGLIEGARKNFGKSLLWGLINLAVAITIFVNYNFYGSIKTAWGQYLQIFIVMLAVIWTATQFYMLPYFMELEVKSLRTSMRNGVLTALAAPLYTLILLLFCLIVLVISFGLIIPTFLGLPALIPILGVRAMNDRLVAFGLRKREKTPKEIEAEESSRISMPNMERVPGDAAAQGAPGAEVSQGQVEEKE